MLTTISKWILSYSVNFEYVFHPFYYPPIQYRKAYKLQCRIVDNCTEYVVTLFWRVYTWMKKKWETMLNDKYEFSHSYICWIFFHRSEAVKMLKNNLHSHCSSCFLWQRGLRIAIFRYFFPQQKLFTYDCGCINETYTHINLYDEQKIVGFSVHKPILFQHVPKIVFVSTFKSGQSYWVEPLKLWCVSWIDDPTYQSLIWGRMINSCSISMESDCKWSNKNQSM